jgi:hypothetical protein
LAKGASSLIAKEVRAQSLSQFVSTLQPEQRQIIKWNELTQQMGEVMDLSGIVMSEEEIEEQMQSPIFTMVIVPTINCTCAASAVYVFFFYLIMHQHHCRRLHVCLPNVKYEIPDTLSFTNVLVYSTDATVAVFTANFTFVGNGNGNYIENGFSSYGKVFKWVAPIDGIKQGNYEPVQRLTAPRKQRMVVAGHTAKWGTEKNAWTMNVEGAYSDVDANTFSNLNDRNNQGFAIKANLKEKISRGKEGRAWLWELNTENLSSTFSRIERFREVEFERNWL